MLSAILDRLMKTQTYTYNPRFKAFFKLLGFNLGLMLIPIVVCYLIFDYGAPVKDYLKSVGFILCLYPAMNSIIGAYSARKQTFTISAVDNPGMVAGWVVEVLQKNDMRIVAEHENEVILEPKSRYLRWFGKQFGPGPTSVHYNQHDVIIAGTMKAVDIIDTKIRFGRVDFKELPYKHS